MDYLWNESSLPRAAAKIVEGEYLNAQSCLFFILKKRVKAYWVYRNSQSSF